MAQTQAQARQALIDQLDSLGTGKAQFSEADIFTDAEKDVSRFIKRVMNNIESADMVLSGSIEELGVVVTKDGIEVRGHEHLLYQDRGVKGSENASKAPNSPHAYSDKMPPLQVFIDYITRKNLNLKNQAQFFEGESPFKELTKEELIEKAARAMQVYIFKNGFKPRNIFAKEIPLLKEDLKTSIKDFAADSIKQVFKFKR